MPRRLGLLLVVVLLILCSCMNPVSESRTIRLRLGYFPQDMYTHSFSLQVATYSESNGEFDLLDSKIVSEVTPLSDDVHTTISTGDSADYVGVYLVAPYSSYPEYFMEWRITNDDESSNSNYFWLDFHEAINNIVSYGLTDKMLSEVSYDTLYKLDFRSQPYYLFRINSTGVSSIRTVVTSLLGKVETASMQDVSDFWMVTYGRQSMSTGTSDASPSPWGTYYFYLYVPGDYVSDNSVTLKYQDQSSISGVSSSLSTRNAVSAGVSSSTMRMLHDSRLKKHLPPIWQTRTK